MAKTLGLIAGIGFGLAVVQAAGVAEARTCNSSSDTGCWTLVTGINVNQLATGASANRIGIACAVNAGSGNSWGGNVYCFAADNTPGGAYIDAQGGEVTGSPFFSSNDPTKRIVSIAIGTDYSRGDGVFIYVLRVDGTIFSAATQWPIPLPGNITLNFTQLASSTVARSLSNDLHLGLILTDTSSNDEFLINVPGGLAWATLGQPPDTVVQNGGNNDDQLSVALWGTTGTTRAVRDLSGTMLPNLPRALTGGAADPNSSFKTDAVGIFGPRQSPLATTCTSNYEYTWAVLPGTCGGSNQPCISRSHRSHGTTTWSSWSSYATGIMYDPTIDPNYPMPTTIQDGFLMRGRFDEIWVIAGYDRLQAYIP